MSEGVSERASEWSGSRLPEGWERPLQAAVCEHCDWRYLVPAERPLGRCPHCFQRKLVPLADEVEELPTLRPPESVVPFEASRESLAKRVEAFADGIPFPPQDLNAEALRSRLEEVYVPTWLVDVEVEALWEAEAGFDYEVISHEERYDDRHGGWTTQEVKETRIRWEPRLGRLARAYDNVPAPALEEDARLRDGLGEWDKGTKEPYRPSGTAEASIALPNRAPEDAWSAAVPAVRQRAADDCQAAAGADHFRQFLWTPEYVERNWTLLLLPLYTTFYRDDEGQAHALLVHGQTGRIDGPRRASMRRARRVSTIVGLVALVIFAIGLAMVGAGLMVPPLAAVGAVGVLVALVVGIAALVPMLLVWQFNRRQGTEGDS
jgi:hypothetical protein